MSRNWRSSSAYEDSERGRWLLLASLLPVWSCGTIGLEQLDLPLVDAAVTAADSGVPLLSLNSSPVYSDASAADPGASAADPDASVASSVASAASDSGLDPCVSLLDGSTSVASACGLGVCARTGTRSCLGGNIIDSCIAAAPSSASDATCDGLDEDCDGMTDEDFVPVPSTCGAGVCARTGALSCVAGKTQDSCAAGAPTSAVDDSFTPGNGLDDDCDGLVDEDVPACSTTPKTYAAGAYANLVVPGNCHHLTVKLWGGAGASGQSVGLGGSGGNGAGGGYATDTLTVTGAMDLFVGTGGAGGCNAGGANAGSASYAGGKGGSGSGANGADGLVAGGGSAGSGGSAGGVGFYGGGGGGQGSPGLLGVGGNGAGGGAATLLFMRGARVVTAGGGGAGGGAAGILLGLLGVNGAAGGSGCAGAGGAAGNGGGGGGGGGICQGSTTLPASGQTPASASSIPAGRAHGGSGSCNAGGDGYAILTFAP